MKNFAMTHLNRLGLLALALAGILAAPSLRAQMQASAVAAVPAIPVAVPAVPAAAGSHPDLDNYNLGPGDSITVLVYQEEDMTTQAKITKDGTVTVPLIGQVKVSGVTSREAADKIREALIKGQFLVAPRVTVVLDAASTRSFIILGQVVRPGTYTFSSQETINLVQAISMAGGFTRIAEPKNVTIVRREGGVQQKFKLNAKKMIEDSDASPFEIKTGDIITVGETFL
jgi:polysaccharide export outer membrane protein